MEADSIFKSLYLGLSLLVVAVVLWLHIMPVDAARFYVTEEGPIEILSWIGWFLAAGILAVIVWRSAWRRGWWAILLLLCCTLRELDFHRRFTGQSILSTRFFFKGNAPWEQRMLGLFIVLILGYACVRVSLDLLPRWWDGIKRRELASLIMVAVLALVPLSKALDRLHGTLTDFGLWHQKDLPITFSILEEVSEFAMPYFAILAILQFYIMSRSKAAVKP